MGFNARNFQSRPKILLNFTEFARVVELCLGEFSALSRSIC